MAFRILLVEDESVVAMGIQAMLHDAGHEIVGIARSGEEAMEIARNTHPDVAIVDINLPGINGVETTRQLVENSHMAVMILTAYADPEFIEGAASSGAFTYLLKPVNKEALCANLQLAVARASEFAELRREVDDIKAALEVRKVSERAEHVLMQRLCISEEEAFGHLRQKCRNQNKTMRETSEEILAADKDFLDLISKEPPKKTGA